MATERAGLIKWIGGATAVISLILGARQLVTIGTERAARARESAEAVAISRQQAARGEFADAWKSLDRAEQQSRTAETGAARLEVAFRWLEEARKPADQPFSSITDLVVPALDRALLDQQHPRRADIVAHIGWAMFLKSRDRGEGDPEPVYRQALTIDPKNVYANIMLAHWLLWNRGSVEDARPYFDAAVASGKERPFVRRMQFAALRNRSTIEGDNEVLRIANSMRQQNETPDSTSVRTIYVTYRTRYATRSPYIDPNTIGVTPSDQLATLAWLARLPGGADGDSTDERIVQTLQSPPPPPPAASERRRSGARN
jgi:hypothetical protein